MSLPSGSRLGPFEIVVPLGAGGMGEVYLARDTRIGREVALKVLSTGVAADPQKVARFGREAHLLAQLNHPNIAALYEFDEDGPTRFLVLEYVPGETLAERIRRGRPPVREALETARQMAVALEAAHAAGIIHRDLKPANVKVTPDGSGEAPRFRAREGARRGELSRDAARRHLGGRHARGARRRDRGLHEPRAGARPHARPENRPLVVRLRPLRAPHRPAGVLGKLDLGRPRLDPRPRARLGRPSGRHPGRRPAPAPALPPQGRGPPARRRRTRRGRDRGDPLGPFGGRGDEGPPRLRPAPPAPHVPADGPRGPGAPRRRRAGGRRAHRRPFGGVGGRWRSVRSRTRRSSRSFRSGT